MPPVSPTLAVNLPPVSTTPVENLLLASMTPVANFATGTAGVVEWQICHRCQRYWWKSCHPNHWHRWQIMGTISDFWNIKVTLKEKTHLYIKSITQMCPKKIIKTFLTEDFFYLPPMSTPPVVHLVLRISSLIFEKNFNGPKGILWCLGETYS